MEAIILNLEKAFSNLEQEGQGGGISMGVTHLLLLGPFYYIQTKFSILFCTRLYVLINLLTSILQSRIFIEKKIFLDYLVFADQYFILASPIYTHKRFFIYMTIYFVLYFEIYNFSSTRIARIFLEY